MKIIYQRDSSGFTVREEKLRWFGHVIMMDIPPPPSSRKRERKKRRFVHVLKQDTQRVDVTEKTAKDRVRWWQVIYCGDA